MDADEFKVVIYTAVGGLKATFITDYLHTAIALILLIYFSLAVLTNEYVGGISGLYQKVKAADDYIEGNYMGSLLTMKSKRGMCWKLYLVPMLSLTQLQLCSSDWCSSLVTSHLYSWTRHSGRRVSLPRSNRSFLPTTLSVLLSLPSPGAPVPLSV